MKVLVTGGAGFIGSHLTRALTGQGHEVTVLDDLSTGRRENLDDLLHAHKVDLRVGSITDRTLVDTCVRNADHVYHLAGTVGVTRVMEQPLTTIRDTVMGTEVVLDACALHHKRVFLASTSEVYGKSLDLGVAAGETLSETDYLVIGNSTNHRWAYATGKLLDEFLALAHAKENGLEVVIGRFFNTVGPGQSGRYGMVIPRFVAAALRSEPIVVYGDGQQKRTFLHVTDAVDAVVRLMASENATNQVFNIGSSKELTIRELAEFVNRATGNKAGIVYESYEEAYGEGFEDMRRRSANTERLNDAIGWQPHSDIHTILADIVSNQRSSSAAAAAG